MQYSQWAKRSSRRGNHGLTVLELLIVLAAIGIVVLVAVPGSSMVMDIWRMNKASSSIVTGLLIHLALKMRQAISRRHGRS